MDGLPLAFSLLVGFSNRAAELVKAALKAHFKTLADTTVSEIALAVSVVAGIAGAFALNVNVFVLFPGSPYLARLPDAAGVIAAGCLASVGSEGIMWLFDLAKGKKAEMIAQPPPGGSTLEESRKVTTGAPVKTTSPENGGAAFPPTPPGHPG